jgi:hypothetical protein
MGYLSVLTQQNLVAEVFSLVISGGNVMWSMQPVLSSYMLNQCPESY